MTNINIDYVVPMVFPDDPCWKKDLWRAAGICEPTNVRYRSWGTEQLLIQCIRTFLPWVRTIYIILARESQVQPWMTATVPAGCPAGLRIVFHHDFMPKEFLPTFNSRAIEMFLHRIPGLSDYFLYGNDDMFPLAPLSVEDFFATPTSHSQSDASMSSSLPCQHMTRKEYPARPNNFQMACMGGLNFVAEEFGLVFKTEWLKGGHSIAPILKSSCEHLWQRGADRIMASVSPFRETKNFNQYIYSWYQHFSGQYVDHLPNICLTSVKSHSCEKMAAEVKNPDNQIVCVNDNECCTNINIYAETVAAVINQRLNTYRL